MTNASPSQMTVLQALDNAIQFTGLVVGKTPLFLQACNNLRKNLNIESFANSPYYQLSTAKPPLWMVNLCGIIAATQKVSSLIVVPNPSNQNSKIGFYGGNQNSIESAFILQILMKWIEAQVDIFIFNHPYPTATELDQYQASVAVGAQSRLFNTMKDMMKSKQLANAGMLN
jgi:hypothetical protein